MTDTPHLKLHTAVRSHQAMRQAVHDAAADLAAQREQEREERIREAQSAEEHQGS